MNRLAKLHLNPLHNKVENMAFVLRLRHQHPVSQPNKADCINLFIQLHYLYSAMEARLAELHDSALLSIFQSEPWLDRSKKIQADIIAMKAQLNRAEKTALIEHVMPAFSAFIEKIKHYNSTELFACFSVRCLGDAFGGQALNKYNQQVFLKTPFTDTFYASAKDQTPTLGKYVNSKELTDNEESIFYATADATFQAHLDLFSEMEKSRRIIKTGSNPCNRYMLFSAAAVASVATAAVALVAYSL